MTPSNNAWINSADGDDAFRYCQHHTVTTDSHHDISSQSSPDSPAMSPHCLVYVNVNPRKDGDVDPKDWGSPDRVVRSVTTITDLAEVYPGRQKTVHRVKVVQEVDLLNCDEVASKTSLSPYAPKSCEANGSLFQLPVYEASTTSSSFWKRFKISPYFFTPTADRKQLLAGDSGNRKYFTRVVSSTEIESPPDSYSPPWYTSTSSPRECSPIPHPNNSQIHSESTASSCQSPSKFESPNPLPAVHSPCRKATSIQGSLNAAYTSDANEA
ncbi:uncharacterized protein LOC108669442 [Hyalella azteca]|uniref:Uncharacterized protein LOC108669442 n=1 Tax=Hyalella azteca TaxID=294128 RepID=A0A8B7NF58_HYAAZ|nr:uncharacterized protein LOC108669442 [Hyalella azteca]